MTAEPRVVVDDRAEYDRFAQVGDLRIHYLDYPGPEPAIVLLHGLSANANEFADLGESNERAGAVSRLRRFTLQRDAGSSHSPKTFDVRAQPPDLMKGVLAVLQ